MQYMTVVIKFPDVDTASKVARETLPYGGQFQGGEITAVYAGDAISENEVFEQNSDPKLIQIVRDQVAAKH